MSRRRRSRGLGASDSFTETVVVYFLGGAAAAWFLTRTLRSMSEGDGPVQGLGAGPRKLTPAQERAIVQSTKKQVERYGVELDARVRIARQREAASRAAALRAQNASQASALDRAQALTAFQDRNVFPGFNPSYPLLAATLRGVR